MHSATSPPHPEAEPRTLWGRTLERLLGRLAPPAPGLPADSVVAPPAAASVRVEAPDHGFDRQDRAYAPRRRCWVAPDRLPELLTQPAAAGYYRPSLAGGPAVALADWPD